jgi:hypothetical protein
MALLKIGDANTSTNPTALPECLQQLPGRLPRNMHITVRSCHIQLDPTPLLLLLPPPLPLALLLPPHLLQGLLQQLYWQQCCFMGVVVQ